MTRATYSFKSDKRVPTFDDRCHLIVFDEVCVLCNGFVQFVLRHDTARKFLFTSAQGDLGQALYQHYDLPKDEFETNLVIIDGALYEKLDAFVAVMTALGGIWKLAAILKVLPRPISNWLYDRIARNRYAIFGKHDACPVPTEQMKARLL